MRRPDNDADRQYSRMMSATGTKAIGKVYLVGAGPGDPGLLTLKGLRCLQQADVILYDGLVNPLLLRHTKAEAQRTARVPTAAGKRLPQEEINRRLIAAAQAGQTVVRLKGGDPYIFGRGGEEAAALAEAGIPFEVVPGITAATAVGAYAGISLTHRRFASQVIFVTGHEDPAKNSTAVDYRLLAEAQATLVFYMGLNRLEAIAGQLQQFGKPAETPCCLISRVTWPAQRVVEGTLADIAQRTQQAGIHAPSLLVVGEVIRQRRAIDWFSRLPLFGLRIGITRPEQQSDSAIARCLELGAEPVLMPTISILPPENWSEVDAALKRLPEFDWLIFTSVNGVRFFLSRLWELGGDARQLGACRIACIGPATEKALQHYHLRADVVPESYRAEELAAALQGDVSGRRVLWPRASRGRDVLPEVLSQAGAHFETVTVYRNVDVETFPEDVQQRLAAGEVDWIGLSSPSIARSLQRLLPETARSHIGKKIRLASISPVTTAAAEEAGLPVAAEATVYTWDGLFEAILHATAQEHPPL